MNKHPSHVFIGSLRHTTRPATTRGLKLKGYSFVSQNLRSGDLRDWRLMTRKSIPFNLRTFTLFPHFPFPIPHFAIMSFG